jgi:hypothetical protein
MRRDDLFERGGFDAPLRSYERRGQRTALSLIASLALALSIIVTVTVVSMGMAQAEILVAMRKGDGSLAIAFIIICLVAGTIVGTVYRRRQQYPD